MRRQEISDFLVETNGQCFICARKVLNEWSSNELASPGSYTSVYRLSQYLKMDMSKVFHEKESIPAELLDNVKRSRLKVSLCEQCTKWNERVAGLCLQLAKIETEVSFYLELIHGSLSSLEKDTRADFRSKLDEDDDYANSNGRLLETERIVKALRTETRQKCSQRLKSVQPIVKVQNVTANQVTLKKQRIHSKSNKKVKPENEVGSGNWFHSMNQTKNEGSDIDGNEDVDDNAQSVEDPNNEDEPNDDPLHITTSVITSNQSYPHLRSEPATVKNVKRASMRGLKLSSEKTLMSSSNSQEVDKLTFVLNPETGKFKCNICLVECTSKSHLKIHYESIHVKLRHKCNLCGKEFADRSPFNRHFQAVHMGVRFKCKLCGKCFTQKGSLVTHQKNLHVGKQLS